MTKSLTIEWHGIEIKFSDIDDDGEVEVILENCNAYNNFVYLNKENIISLKKHLDYLYAKLRNN